MRFLLRFMRCKAQIAGQIYIAMRRLGAGAELLSAFEDWGLTLGDSEIPRTLAQLQQQM